MTTSLAEKTAEIAACNEAHGWYENCATFPEAMALLHSEVSEALEAWRVRGLEDVTCAGHVHTHGYGSKLCKPEGVGSEFADILIRLLDDARIFGFPDLEERLAAQHGRLGFHESFPVNMNTLHTMLALVSIRHEDEFPMPGEPAWQDCLTRVLAFLCQLCEHYGIDLEAEYARKIEFNKSRPYHHGNKRI